MKKSSILISGIILTTIFLGACNNHDSNDAKDVAEEHNDAKFDKTKEKDAQFMVDASDNAMEQIRLCDLASSQAEAYDIKELANMLKEDQSKYLKEIDSIASKKMITLPTDLSQQGNDSHKKLAGETGKSFDRDFSSRMVDLHKEAISKYEKAANDCEDYQIKTFANKKLEQLRMDLDRSMVCRDKYKDNNEHPNKDMSGKK